MQQSVKRSGDKSSAAEDILTPVKQEESEGPVVNEVKLILACDVDLWQ